MKFWEMNEIDKLSAEAYIDLMPDDFLLDPEMYCRRFGDTIYQRFVHVVVCKTIVMLRLNNGDKLNYVNTVFMYEPLDAIGARN